jgi:hypothetical protein
MKPTSRKKSKERKMKIQTVLTIDVFDFIIIAVSNAFHEILQNNKDKQDALYAKIVTEMTGVQHAHTIQSKVMEVTQRLQPIQDEACQLFTEIEGRGIKLEQVITAAEQRLEGPVKDAVIQEFAKQEAVAQQKVELARSKIEDFEAELPRPERLETSHR